MLSDPSRDDLRYLREISESAKEAPLVGGRYLILWGTLISSAYVFEYLILSRQLAWPGWSIPVMWSIIMLAGMTGMTIFDRQLRHKPGCGSATNTTSRIVWKACGFSVSAFGFGAIFAISFGLAPVILFDVIVTIGLAGYGTALYVTSELTSEKWMRWTAMVSYGAVAISPFLIGKPIYYLFSAAIILMVAFIPGVITLRKEPAPLPRESA